jgi:hypothetical protein
MASKQAEEVRSSIRFIFQEIGRLIELERGSLSESEKWQFLASIPDPRFPGGHLPCGYAGLKEVDAISEKALKTRGLSGRVSHQELRQTTGLAVAKLAFANSAEALDTQVAKLLSGIGKAAKLLCKDTSFLFPCHLMTADRPESFTIGPVRFFSRQSFRKIIIDKIRSELGNTEARYNKIERDLIADSIRYYRNFRWVAEVHVKQASDEIALQLAKSLAGAALDCLHLTFGGNHSRHMRIGMDAPGRGTSAQLRVAGSGNLWASVSYGGQGHVGFDADWWDELTGNPAAAQTLESHSQLISLMQSGIGKRPIAIRFLDAAQWFGEAVRESHEAARIVKITNGLERLLIARQTPDIGETLAQRVSAICKLSFEEVTENQFYERARKAYRLRSELVHGDRSPGDDKVRKIVFDCEDLAEKTLKSALLCFHRVGLFGASANPQVFEAFMDDVVKRGDDALPQIGRVAAKA